MRQINKYKSGLTLIELVASVLLVSFILIAVWAVYNVGFKAFSGQETRVGVMPEVERALFELGSDLRQAVSVTSAQATSLTFTADTNSDGINETIQYAWGGAPSDPLNKVVSSVTRPVVHSVSSLVFTYYNSSNTLLSLPVTAANVRLVVITMTVTSGSESFTIRTASDLRCI